MKKISKYSKKSTHLSSKLGLLYLLLLCSCATKLPIEKGNFKKTDLVELTKLDSTIHLDIRYATANNLVGRAVYTEARAFLQRPAAEDLVKIIIIIYK